MEDKTKNNALFCDLKKNNFKLLKVLKSKHLKKSIDSGSGKLYEITNKTKNKKKQLLITMDFLLILIALATIFILYFLIRLLEKKLTYKPIFKITDEPSTFNLEFEDIHFLSEDAKKLHGWWIPHPEAIGTVLYCHGNADNMSGRAWHCKYYHDMKVNVFMFDYRGYGKSNGWSNEKGTYKDARAAYEVVRSFYQDQEKLPVIIMGVSLGAAVAAELAGERHCEGLILESTFSSLPDIAKIIHPYLPINWLTRNKYETINKVADLTMPKLFSHSKEDDLIPYEMGQALYQKGSEPKEWFELKGTHGEDSFTQSPGYKEKMEEFITRCLKEYRTSA